MRLYCKILVLLLAALLLSGLFCACGKDGEPTAYQAEHTHVYGFWYPCGTEGEEIRYCKICRLEETRVKE